MGIPFLLDEQAHRMGLTRWVEIDYEKSPHTILAGRTGSGKTVIAKLLLARTILLAPPELQPVEVAILDPKEDLDFSFLQGLSRFYSGDEAPKGFNTFYTEYLARKEKRNITTNLKILFVDEFASLVNLIGEKAEREAVQKHLTLLLQLSRSRHFSVQLATQQPSSQIFGSSGTGSREQFGVACLLGDSGVETQKMLLGSDSVARIKEYGPIGGRGVGWLSINGGVAQPVRVPFVGNMAKMDKVIYDNLARNQTPPSAGA